MFRFSSIIFYYKNIFFFYQKLLLYWNISWFSFLCTTILYILRITSETNCKYISSMKNVKIKCFPCTLRLWIKLWIAFTIPFLLTYKNHQILHVFLVRLNFFSFRFLFSIYLHFFSTFIGVTKASVCFENCNSTVNLKMSFMTVDEKLSICEMTRFHTGNQDLNLTTAAKVFNIN